MHPIFENVQDFTPLEILNIGTLLLKKVQSLDDIQRDMVK